MYVFQRDFMYYPFGKILIIPEEFQEISLKTPDNLNIYGWFKAPNKGQKTILYFHGNAGNLMGRSDRFEKFANQYGLLAISYRGYSKSEGKPSEKGFYLDAQAALEFLKSKNINSENIIIFGESIGSGVAVELASQHNFAGLILEAPFSSILSVAKKSYWFLPVSVILKDRFESDKKVYKIKTPILIFHATGDNIVPFSEGKKLYNMAIAKKKFIEITGDFHVAINADYILKNIDEFYQDIKLNKI